MRAIIVGTSSTLLEKPNGKIIDNFDYVARSISAAEFPGYEDFLGTKTDLYWSKYQYLFRLKYLQQPFNKDILLLNDDADNYYETCTLTSYIDHYNRLFYDGWRDIISKKHVFSKVYFYSKTQLDRLHKKMMYRNNYDAKNIPAVYSSAGARVIDFFVQSKQFTEVYVTGFSFFDKATYFCPQVNHNIREHCYYKEKYFYTSLLKNNKIKEL